MTTKGGRKALLSFAGSLPKDAEITYTREGKAKIAFSLVQGEVTKKREDGSYPQGASVWFNLDAWPNEAQAAEWMPLLKKGASVAVFNAELSVSTGQDGKVWQNWRVNLFSGLFADSKPSTGSAAGASSTGSTSKWAEVDSEDSLTDPE